MKKIVRRKFFKNLSAVCASWILGACWFSSYADKSRAETIDDELECLPVQNENPAISRLSRKCDPCGDCIEVCADKQKVFGTYQASPVNHVCIHCGACIIVCEEHALTEKFHWQYVKEAIDNPTKIVVASISPAVRVGIGDYFGMDAGSLLTENIVGACRAVGFDYVLDTNFSADLTIMEEAFELQKRIQEGKYLPLFTSCCPSWVKYAEIYYPSLLHLLSSARSPVAMQGSMVKSYFAQKKGIDPENIIHVAVTPCSAKKYEITRGELSIGGLNGTDFAITTNELAKLLKMRKIDLVAYVGKFDSLMGTGSGGGIIFGNTGGVLRSALRTVYHRITGNNPPGNLLELNQVQGLSGLREAKVLIGSMILNVAVCYEMRHAKILLDQALNGSSKYHFIEVMACKGGCVGGAGQPANTNYIEKRMVALNDADIKSHNRYSHDNPEIKAIYEDFLGQVGGPLAKKFLHTAFNDKSNLLL